MERTQIHFASLSVTATTLIAVVVNGDRDQHYCNNFNDITFIFASCFFLSDVLSNNKVVKIFLVMRSVEVEDTAEDGLI